MADLLWLFGQVFSWLFCNISGSTTFILFPISLVCSIWRLISWLFVIKRDCYCQRGWWLTEFLCSPWTHAMIFFILSPGLLIPLMSAGGLIFCHCSWLFVIRRNCYCQRGWWLTEFLCSPWTHAMIFFILSPGLLIPLMSAGGLIVCHCCLF
jgi:hypothetical protein